MSFVFLYQNICCGYSKEPSKWDEHPKQVWVRKYLQFYAHKFCLSKTMRYNAKIIFIHNLDVRTYPCFLGTQQMLMHEKKCLMPITLDNAKGP